MVKRDYIGAFLDGYFSVNKTVFGFNYFTELEKATDLANKKWREYKKQLKNKL